MGESQTSPKEPTEKPTYAEKTTRIQALSQLIKSISPILWVFVILIVIIPYFGKFFLVNSSNPIENLNKLKPAEEVVITIQNQNEIDQALVSAFQDARTQAKNLAEAELNQWIDELMTRVDNNFIPWYFNYFQQKWLEFKTPFIYLESAIIHQINDRQPSPNQVVAEKLTEEVQTEFAKRVLRPKIAQLQLERITRETSNLYLETIKTNVANIQTRYNIPQGKWDNYLDDIAITITDTEGNISNLSMKVIVGGSTYLLAKAIIPSAAKIGSKLALSLAGKSSAKLAAKTGGTVAAKLGVEFLDPIVGIGIILWDLWDYNHTVEVEKPILREAILDYLKEVKNSLLDNQKNSIMSAIYQLENSIIKSL
ncbi:conserved hypothetical protein [Gloeothece citriformis PCC 7424]|uniref:Uncharacterized protein n=1 Tax=Gloeothece citriformis (strain PCC 7424) TaxID=65393 RepID=B7KIV4_GLOC7|nr:hypothetical protein [Gloeothece citriformis]ACK70790.1 conserved hypothetical protein [Gloeothece citriformis PCC 7424]